jgi:molecular chaperone GrpE
MPSSPASEHGRQPTDVSDGGPEASIEELLRELDAARRELGLARDRELRARADLENYRKRSQRELDRLTLEQHDELLRSWLEAVDSVERALALDQGHPEAAEGLRAILDQMDAILRRQGVRRIGQVGDAFDPELHDAVAVVSPDGLEPGTIADVPRFGYAAGDRILRPAQVVVARSRAPES